MSVYRVIAPQWLKEQSPNLRVAFDGVYSEDELLSFNEQGYSIYFFPNYPSLFEGGNVKGYQVDTFEYVFADMDLKDKVYEDKAQFIDLVQKFPLTPTRIVDSGNGVHAYWRISDLNAQDYLKLQRRIARHLKTDPQVSLLSQLMRCPGFVNTKHKDAFKMCEAISETDISYTCEDLDKVLPLITKEDEDYCELHYNNTHNRDQVKMEIDTAIPLKFAKLLEASPEVKEIWSGTKTDRSEADFRLGHIMFASGFTKDEAASVLVNSGKALERAPIHRISYASNIIEKIWTYEITKDKEALNLSMSVKDILQRVGTDLKGTRFPCWSYLDNTQNGFRLGQVIGLVGGVGCGKTAIALNMFMGFVQSNPDYEHFFIPLEQPAREIADRWKTMCGSNTVLYDKVHVLSNYDEQGGYRNLSLEEIQEYLVKFQKVTGKKVGCVVIDHIGVLKKNNKDGRQSIEDICHKMKAFAMKTNTMLIMQSQAPREKAGIGDLELDKDGAYGTVFFEAYCDYLITMWQPLKRCYKDGAPTITAFKFCKIRHKKQGKDLIKEDVCYKLKFDPETEHLRELTQDEEMAFSFYLTKSTNRRKQDRKTDLVEYSSVKIEEKTDGTTDSNKKPGPAGSTSNIH